MPWEANTILETRILYVVNNQKCMNVLHYTPDPDAGEGFTPTELTLEFAEENGLLLPNSLSLAFQAISATNVVIQYFQAQQVFPIRRRAATVVPNLTGTRPGICHTQNLQAAITKLGEIGDRHNQGGVRVGGIPSTDIVNGLITDPYLTALVALMEKLKLIRSDGAAAGSYYPVIANKRPIPGTDPVKFEYYGSSVIKTWFAHNEVRTANRRSVGKGV